MGFWLRWLGIFYKLLNNAILCTQNCIFLKTFLIGKLFLIVKSCFHSMDEKVQTCRIQKKTLLLSVFQSAVLYVIHVSHSAILDFLWWKYTKYVKEETCLKECCSEMNIHWLSSSWKVAHFLRAVRYTVPAETFPGFCKLQASCHYSKALCAIPKNVGLHKKANTTSLFLVLNG
jgi:hypothetical protein